MRRGMLRISIILAAALLIDLLICFLVGRFLQFSPEPAGPVERDAASFSGFSESPPSVQPHA
jgi:hypothetical protein